ncbi:MAG: OmpA family protein [Deltaproteobacteria bacterium]|nr:OmpA family protein [Deltaproteobacteria bacterium]
MKTLSQIASIALVLLIAQSAAAQSESREFSVRTFHGAPGFGSFLSVEGATVPEKLGLRVGFLLDYHYKPLKARVCQQVEGEQCTDWGGSETGIIEHRLMGELLASLALFHIFEVGVALPGILFQAGNDVGDPSSGDGIAGPSKAAGLEDLRLHLKLDVLRGIFGYDGGKFDFNLALVPSMSFPIGNAVVADSFMGDSFFTFHPKLALGAKIGRVRLGLNVGYLIVKEKETYVETIGSRLTYGAAAEVDIVGNLSGIVELFGTQAFSSDIASTPLEGALAAKFGFGRGFAVFAGPGFGIISGLGTPIVRGIVGITWTPTLLADGDGDGVTGANDRCPGEPEDKDGFEDSDGCPELDNDGDDIDDKADKCPDQSEDKDDFEDEDGCPDPDNDADGIDDGYDTCPNEKEDKDNFNDEDGCPDPDNDGDGIDDEADKCSEEKEIFNAFEDLDGCPDEGEELVILTDEMLAISRPIEFKRRTSKIKNKKSFDVLNTVVTLLKIHPQLRVRIEGHTDSRRSRRRNLKISSSQAGAVLRYLIENGIEADRLEALGHGPDNPIDDNNTEEGRRANQRIEFHIIGKDKE